jgi:hypothetical protein
MDTDQDYTLQKQKARALYEEGKLDEALAALQGVPPDEETRQLRRALRYADEARGIVSNVSPESQKYFEDLLRRMENEKQSNA